MTSIEQDPEDQAEEYAVEERPDAEEHNATPSTDPLTAEADPADIADQLEEAPLDERRDFEGGEPGGDEAVEED